MEQRATAEPREVGLEPVRLGRIDTAFHAEVEEGRIPGAVVLIARHGKIAYLKSFGFQDREKRIPMKTDAIFRIASLTKPIISTAALMLAEEGKLRITAPVSQYLPEFTNLKVRVERPSASGGRPELVLEPQRGEMTIYDLLRHTSGLGHFLIGTSLVNEAYRAADVAAPNQTLSELMTKLCRLPLAFHPGTTFEYGLSTDVLGRVIEVISQMDLDQFIAERVTKPLGMMDTGFYVNGFQASRIAEPQVDTATGSRPPMRDVLNRPNWMSGGGGMVSTASDYAEFCQMFLNEGQLGKVRLLSPKTVAHMTANQLPPHTAMSATVQQLFGSLTPSPAQGQGFGLGFAVRNGVGLNPLPGSPGEYYWVGSTGTVFWIDPKEQLIAVMLVQALGVLHHYQSLIRNLVYQSIVN
jgi:CubicO group peptidase (beta-lactamase class C family)